MNIQEHIGIDDGYNTIVAYTGYGESIVVPSRVNFGRRGEMSFQKDAPTNETGVYHTDGAFITVTPNGTENIVNDDYSVSNANRALIAHALKQLQHRPEGADIHICTGLPVDEYFRPDAKVNSKNVERKIASLQKEVECVDSGLVTSFPRNAVMSEGVAAIFDMAFQETRDPNGNPNGAPRVIAHEDVFKKDIAIIDIGGRTTDIIIWSSGSIQEGSFGTVNVGMETIYSSMKKHLVSEFGLPKDHFGYEKLVSAFKNKSINLSGREHLLADMIDPLINEVKERVENMVQTVVGSKALMLDEVRFIGGGAAELMNAGMKKMYNHQVLAEQPMLVNARGFYKYVRYVA